MIEEQDKDKAAAASRVNLKMRNGMDIVRRSDPQAVLQTYGYYTYPVYSDDQGQPRQANRPRQPIGWRVGQFLGVRTVNLQGLPKTVAAAQQTLALSSLHFGLAESTRKKVEAQQYAVAYADLVERVKAIAQAMGRSFGDAVLESLDFDGAGLWEPQREMMATAALRKTPEPQQVEEPSFEPGETSSSLRVVAKVRFK